MARWLVKTEPGDYAFARLVKDGRTRWEGVRNAQALIHLRAMRKGDEVFVYHTGGEKAVVGIAKAATDAYPDPKRRDAKLVVVDLVPVRPLANPVPLAEIRRRPSMKVFDLVRISRLSVMPVPDGVWRELLELAEA